MKFYRRLLPFKAISFDLDDTLYSNYPVMLATDKKMAAYFIRTLPEHITTSVNSQLSFDYHFWLPYKKQALVNNPDVIHDVALWRVESYTLGMINLGIAAPKAQVLAKLGLQEFEMHRSDFTVPEDIHQLLAELGKRWPLIAISNGNVNTHKIGINQYFTQVYHAGEPYKQKPHSDMFDQACSNLNIAPHELLHVGDCGRSDIRGGVLAGCQTAWLSCYDVGKPLSILPNIELSDVAELHHLL